jgi:NADH dehydrogenase/NADH:ubiquinone oxidoreductase subunit G
MNDQQRIEITLDGKKVLIPAHWTLLEALSHHGVDTPVICYHEATTPEGICRQCVVEIDGRRTLLPACVTYVGEGMVVQSSSERVVRARRTILEMLHASTDLSQSPELLYQSEEYTADPDRFPTAKKRNQPSIDDNPFYVRDYEKCILCWRCVQACGDDLQFTYALSVGGRGHGSHIATFFDAPIPETTCVFCGNCVAVCPTGALKGKTEFFLEQGLDYDQIRLEKRKNRRKKSAREDDHD